MNPTIKTAIPIFLLTQVGNVAMVIDLHSRGDSIAGCIVKACAIALLSIILSVIIAGFVMAHIDVPFLSSRDKPPAQPHKKTNWGLYAPVIVGFSLFIALMVAAIASQVDSYHEGRSLAMCISYGALMTVGSGVTSALAGLAVHGVRSEL